MIQQSWQTTCYGNFIIMVQVLGTLVVQHSLYDEVKLVRVPPTTLKMSLTKYVIEPII